MANVKKGSKKKESRVKPESLGTGLLGKTASVIVERRKKTCTEGGGSWNAKELRCEW